MPNQTTVYSSRPGSTDVRVGADTPMWMCSEGLVWLALEMTLLGLTYLNVSALRQSGEDESEVCIHTTEAKKS